MCPVSKFKPVFTEPACYGPDSGRFEDLVDVVLDLLRECCEDSVADAIEAATSDEEVNELLDAALAALDSNAAFGLVFKLDGGRLCLKRDPVFKKPADFPILDAAAHVLTVCRLLKQTLEPENYELAGRLWEAYNCALTVNALGTSAASDVVDKVYKKLFDEAMDVLNQHTADGLRWYVADTGKVLRLGY